MMPRVYKIGLRGETEYKYNVSNLHRHVSYKSLSCTQTQSFAFLHMTERGLCSKEIEGVEISRVSICMKNPVRIFLPTGTLQFLQKKSGNQR